MSALDYKDIGDSYDYPNIRTYRPGRAVGTVLAKGAIFSVVAKTVEVSSSPTNPTNNGTNRNRRPTVTVNRLPPDKGSYFKRFQFNPPTLQFSTAFAAVDPLGTEQSGGGAANVTGLGIMSSSIELMFVRDTEVFRATNGNLGGGRMNQEAAAVYARIGVQKDIYDLYRVILANNTDIPEGYADIALPEDMTLSALTGKAFDLAGAGSQLYGKQVGLLINDDMIVYGMVQSLNIVYNKFNYKLVPTIAIAKIVLDVTNVVPSGVNPYGSTSTSENTANTRGGTNRGVAAGTPSAEPDNGTGRR